MCSCSTSGEEEDMSKKLVVPPRPIDPEDDHRSHESRYDQGVPGKRTAGFHR